jgi:hypothetical protein
VIHEAEDAVCPAHNFELEFAGGSRTAEIRAVAA